MRISTRLYAGKDDDLIAWTSSLNSGDKSNEIKRVLRLGLQQPRNIPGTTNTNLDAEALREALAGDFRQILEAAFDSIAITGPKANQPTEDDEVEQMLDNFDFGL